MAAVGYVFGLEYTQEPFQGEDQSGQYITEKDIQVNTDPVEIIIPDLGKLEDLPSSNNAENTDQLTTGSTQTTQTTPETKPVKLTYSEMKPNWLFVIGAIILLIIILKKI